MKKRNRYRKIGLSNAEMPRLAETAVLSEPFASSSNGSPPRIFVFSYDEESIKEEELSSIDELRKYRDVGRKIWINVDGIRKNDVLQIGAEFQIHPLLVEDILSEGQRPKLDEVDDILFCLLNMLYFNEQYLEVEAEQISIALGKNFIISFQEDNDKDVFDPIREKLRMPNTKLRQRDPDYLLYSMIDLIVDKYYSVLENLGEKIEQTEDEIIHTANIRSLGKINGLRKELITLRKNISPVRDIVNSILRSDSDLLEERTTKYFKDIYDHIVQANELVESYRDMVMSLQDLYMNRVNLRLNEVMKVIAIVTCLMAPATVIGGIFGMNFSVIPLTHQTEGFYIAVGLMIIIPLIMLYIFKRRGWY